jgi:integrase
MAQTLNDQTAKRLECIDGKHHVIFWDEKLKGFGLRVTARGARSWVVDYRCNGKQRRKTIGSTELWGCGAARDEARIILRDASRGIDRMLRHEAPTVRDMWHRYENRELTKLAEGTQSNVRSMWQTHVLPAIGNRTLEEVKLDDINDLHQEITDSGSAVQANRTIDSVRHFFNLAIDWGWIEKNPATKIHRNREYPREVYLTPEEIKRVYQALERCRNQTSAQAIQVIILTGARKSEVLNMRWDQLDLGGHIWLKPGFTTKQRRSHRVVLNGAAVTLLCKRQEKASGQYVFPGVDGKPLKHIRRTWISVCRETGFMKDGEPTVRIHDLRHSFASVLAAAGYSLKIIGDMLGHSQPQTTNRYAHLIDGVQREAADRIGAIVEPVSVDSE